LVGFYSLETVKKDFYFSPKKNTQILPSPSLPYSLKDYKGEKERGGRGGVDKRVKARGGDGGEVRGRGGERGKSREDGYIDGY
jgi:hypothetical protein